MAKRLQMDWILFVTIGVMLMIGLVMVYSASSVIAEVRYGEKSWHFLSRQAVAALIGMTAFMVLRARDYKDFKQPGWAMAFLGVVVMLLVIVFFADRTTHRWIRLGGIQLQPSDLAKPALAIFLAYFVTLRPNLINSKRNLWSAAIAIVLLAGLVVLGDLGTAVVLVAMAAAVFWAAGIEKRYIITAAAAGSVLIAGAIVMKPYRLARILGYVDPGYKLLDRIDPKGVVKTYAHSSTATRDTSYQGKQARIAVGSGGVLGQGLGQGTQKLLYLPEAHTDFIYAVIGEELGLWGCSALLAGFMIIFWRGLRLFWAASDDFGRYLALGITASIIFQALMNMSVVLDMAPTKGIALPLISYGGTSLVSTLISLGLLTSVSERAA